MDETHIDPCFTPTMMAAVPYRDMDRAADITSVGGLSHGRPYSAGRHPQAGRRNGRHTQRDPPGYPHQGDEYEGEMVRDED